MPTKVVIYTGSFDPITLGHLDIITRASATFQNVYIGIGDNPAKKYLFTKGERHNLMTNRVCHLNNVKVIEIPNNRLSVDVAYEMGASIIKGVRLNAADFDYEWLRKHKT